MIYYPYFCFIVNTQLCKMGTGSSKAKADKKVTPRTPRTKKADKLSLDAVAPVPPAELVIEAEVKPEQPMEKTSGLISRAEFDALPDEQKLVILEAKIAELNKRQAWQEQIHRHIMPNGNIAHFYNIIPSMLIAAVAGGIGALAVILIVDQIKNKG